VADSAAAYGVDLWSAGFFGINEAGHAVVRPSRDTTEAGVDLYGLVEDLRERGHDLPLLLRFSDILRERVTEVATCFERAIEDYEYQGAYRGVFPIKVNQQAQVVSELLSSGRPYHLGVEAGSKPELLVALAMLDDPEALIVCNGYKDAAYVETALLAQKLGRNPILVMDRFRELDLTLRVAREHGIRPNIGVRAKLHSPGGGRWSESGGAGSKFGLTMPELVRTVEVLEREDMLDSLQFLHFHVGSQVPSIRVIKDALREASRVFVELHAMGAGMKYFDVGGGLAVDYDGSKTDFHSSMNYSIQEYANDVVAFIADACRQRGVPEPSIVSESGRALTAHHAVLVFDILDVNRAGEHVDVGGPATDDPDVVTELHDTLGQITRENLREPYHDALELRQQAHQLFGLGYLGLAGRARAESLYLAICTRLQQHLAELEQVPEDLESLGEQLADTYYCNFSLFQSMPDSWAVDQLFPIMPIHRLNERPTRRGTLADLTCDSDGRVDSFIDLEDVNKVLPLHSTNGEPYYVAAFLVGAYQEILGDLHNLFGDTNAIRVVCSGDRYRVAHVQRGDTVSDVLGYVAFDRRDLLRRVQETCEQALWEKRVSARETALLLKRFEEGLNAYTYLRVDPD
jgi:arginine decarboxylase